MNVLLSLKKIQESSEDKHLDMEVIRRECGKEIEDISRLYGISEIQCVLLAEILELDAYCGGNVVNLTGAFQCKTVDIYMLIDDIENLIQRGYLYLFTEDYPDKKYRINPAALKAFRENRQLDHVVKKCDCTKELADEMIRLHKEFVEGQIGAGDFRNRLVETLQINGELRMAGILKGVISSYPTIEYVATILATIHWIKEGNATTAEQLRAVCLDGDEEKELRELLARKNVRGIAGGVVSAGLIVLADRDAEGVAQSITLTQNTKTELWEFFAQNESSHACGSSRKVQDPCSSDPSECDMLRPVAKHPEKQLLMDDEQQAQYDDLVNLLQKDRMGTINKELRRLGLKSGFTCLFYGPAGTGKTETVYQIGNATGRDIYQVDMSMLHGKWVGDSERHTQQIFDQYFSKILHSKSTPILLLNEADAIISKRLINVDTSVGMMYNRVQNIILQALEDFQGILIATTNLEQNFDTAFERRFLYKMRFRRPSEKVRARLWSSMSHGLSDDDCRQLADEFPTFAGGQIANVSRKALIDEALHGRAIDLQRMREFCRQETIADKEHPIGFKAQ